MEKEWKRKDYKELIIKVSEGKGINYSRIKEKKYKGEGKKIEMKWKGKEIR